MTNIKRCKFNLNQIKKKFYCYGRSNQLKLIIFKYCKNNTFFVLLLFFIYLEIYYS